jgi:methylase of polypeptide subunit release factors
MSSPVTLEETLLRSATALIRDRIDATDRQQKFELLEAAAAELGGFPLRSYYNAFDFECRSAASTIRSAAQELVSLLRDLPIHPSLALTALARPAMRRSEQRTKGSYFTDFRLAAAVAERLSEAKGKLRILDPASGSGILLVAAALRLAGTDRRRRRGLIAEGIFAADISVEALRGAALALCSLTNDAGVVRSLVGHLRCADSLVRRTSLWCDVAPAGFDAVIGNPPWEKLKVTRHEFLVAAGEGRHYGAEYSDLGLQNLGKAKSRIAKYAFDLNKSSTLQGAGEPDLYKLFLELAFTLARPGGEVVLLVPGGLLRSNGTAQLRKFLYSKTSALEFTILENRARFFSIDTRFKFLAVRAKLVNGYPTTPLVVQHGTGTQSGIKITGTVKISRRTLAPLRPDLSVPEVRSSDEWALFRSLCRSAKRVGDRDEPWSPLLMREVDMTRNQSSFHRVAGAGLIPLLEGRMLHQNRHGAKRYLSGTGRRAIWRPVEFGICDIVPQFWYPETSLPASVRRRTAVSRVGFCDITGQTNERTMLAARIPPGVVCGNKVPTMVFPNAGSDEGLLSDTWIGVLNSFTFDWLLRRIVTTTVNYFLLLDLPFPFLANFEAEAKRIAQLAHDLNKCRHTGSAEIGVTGWKAAEMRAAIEVRVLRMYLQDCDTLNLILADFPLLDREQPALPGECRSTITKDLVRLRAAEYFSAGPKADVRELGERVDQARRAGAIPFVPSDFERQLSKVDA